jgi:hypothetical protein
VAGVVCVVWSVKFVEFVVTGRVPAQFARFARNSTAGSKLEPLQILRKQVGAEAHGAATWLKTFKVVEGCRERRQLTTPRASRHERAQSSLADVINKLGLTTALHPQLARVPARRVHVHAGAMMAAARGNCLQQQVHLDVTGDSEP